MSLLRQSLLVGVTAVFVAFIIPAYRKPSLPVPEIFGTVAQGFEEVKEVFRKNYEDHWDVSEGGSAFSVYLEGQKVVDLWAGYADLEAKRLWREDTMTIISSTTKGLVALCVAMLVDRGYVDFKKPVAHYWPEFAQKGKEKITVEQLLEHEAGVYKFKEKISFDLLRDHEAMDKMLAETEPGWEPGSRHGYHTLSFGPYIDALVRRTDPEKRTVGKFFDDEVRKAFDIDAYIGTPFELNYRMARCSFVEGTWSHLWYALRNIEFFRKSLTSLITGQDSYFARSVENCDEVCEFERMSDPEILKLELASANGVATASGLAKLFGILANGGTVGNKTLLSKKILDEYANDRRDLTPDLVLFDMLIRWKYGMNVIPQPNNGGNLFGAPGSGGQIGYADPNNKLGYGFVTTYISPIGLQLHDPRIKNLMESVLKVVQARKKQ